MTFLKIVSRRFLFLLLLTGLLLQDTAYARKILVEASRIEPSRSTTIITAEEIEQSGAATVADILREVPGVELIRQGPLGQTASVFLRGSRAESTLVLIDGVEVNDVMHPGSGFDFSVLSADSVSRVEIYRGPQSVRFGAGALGGVIHIMTREGRPGIHSYTAVEAGSYNTWKTNIGVEGGSDQLKSTLSYEHLSTDGFSVAAGDPDGDADGATLRTFNSKTTWAPNPNSKANLILRHSEANLDFDQFGGPSGDDPNFTGKTVQWLAGLSGSGRFLDERWLSEVGLYFSQLDRKTRNLPDPNNSSDSSDHFRGQQRKVRWDNEFLFSENHRLLFQLEGRDERGRSDSTFPTLPPSLDQKVETVMGESLTYLYEDDQWFADVGARSDQSSKVSSLVSHRVSAGRYFQGRSTKVAVSYGTGFKLPSLYQLYSTYGDENLKAEESSTYEVSLEKTVGDSLQAVVTYFDSEFKELIDFNPHTSTYFNMAQASSQGVETQLHWSLGSAWGISAWYTYLDAKDDSTGGQLLRRPLHSGGAELTLERRKLNAYIQYLYRGKRPDLDPVTFNPSSNRSYDLTHLGAGYALSENLQLSVRLENLFDRSYQEVLGYSAPRRSVYVQLRAQSSFPAL